MSATHARLQQNLFARTHPVNQLAPLAHDACHVVTKNVRKPYFDAGQALTYPNVQMIERARAHLDQNLVRAYARLRALLVAEHFGPSVLVEDDGFHVFDFRSGLRHR